MGKPQLAGVLVLAFTTFHVCWSQSENDRSLLLSVKSAIDNWVDFKAANGIQGWDGSDYCTWTGVICTADQLVSRIDLACRGCQRQAIGMVIPDLGNFTSLEHVDFSNQYLTGPLPQSWSGAGKMQSLLTLNLSHNRLTGILPAWSEKNAFPALKALSLDYNQISGALPVTWGVSTNFQALELLNLEHNSLAGELPAEWGDEDAWYVLRALNLGHNNLTGGIPEDWVEGLGFAKLEVLALSNNNLEGDLPFGFGEPPASLQLLDLSSNLFAGTLPSNWSDIGTSNLKELHIDNCRVIGTLPNSWGSQSAFQALQVLHLHGNKIEGAMPPSWSNKGAFPQLRILNLEDNWLMNRLEPSWGNKSAFPALETLDLAYNSFYRELPAEWGHNGSFPSLQTLNLTANYLTGTLPASWGTPGALSSLSNLSLIWNRLSGTIPSSWSNLEALSTLWVQPGNYQLCQGPPANSKVQLCKYLGDGCVTMTNLGPTCSFSPPTAAAYLPPSMNTTAMQAILRLRNGTSISETGISNSLTSALLYVMTSAQTAQVIELSRPVSDSRSFSVPKRSNSTRRLLAAYSDTEAAGLDSSLSSRRLLHEDPPPPTPSLSSSVLDADVQFWAANASNVYKMEEQLMTVLNSNAVLNVLGSLGVRLTSIQLLAVEPAAEGDVPGWWERVSPWNPNTSNKQAGSTVPASTPVIRRGNGHDLHAIIITMSLIGAFLIALLATAMFLFFRRRHRTSGKIEEGVKESNASSQSSSQISWQADGRDASICLASCRSLQLTEIGSRAGDQSALKPQPDEEAQMAVAALERRGSQSHQAGDGLLSGTVTSVSLPTMPWSDWEIRPSEIQICQRSNGEMWQLGSGSFGKVYKAMRSSSQPVAVKMLHERDDCPGFGQEIALLKACRHSNIVAFQGVCVQDGCTMLVTEFMEGGDLFRALSHPDARKMLQWRNCGRNVALDVARGLLFLHNHHVVHFDLKSHNILLSREGTAKITDVGLARITHNGYISKLDDVVGTFEWAAPELLLGHRCTEKIDIYSFGVLLWELAVTTHTGQRPKRGQMREVRVPEELPAAVEKLRQDCVESDPKLRPSARQVFEVLASS